MNDLLKQGLTKNLVSLYTDGGFNFDSQRC